MTIIITGASGMIGGLVLKNCIDNPKITKIISFVRRKTKIKSEKLQEIEVADFGNINEYRNYFCNIDVCYFCLGAYTGQFSDAIFKQITMDYLTNFVDLIKEKSPQCRFCLLSGQGADSKEISKISFAKYKGMAENYMFANLKEAYSFRPSYIYPVERRNEPNVGYKIFRSLYPLVKLLGKNFSIKSTDLANRIVEIGLNGYPKNVLENKDLRE